MNPTASCRPLPWLLGAALALSACGGGNSTSTLPLSSVVRPDPLYPHQWHLENTGQAGFSAEAGTPGIDLNVKSVFEAGDRGGGVKVLVLDEGIDIRHEDLAANVDRSMLRNFDPSAKDASDPMPLDIGGAHGMAVAGIIAAAADNGLGGRGVAPKAALGSVNYLCDACDSDSVNNVFAAYGGAPYSESAWVFNASYGIEPTHPVGNIDIDVHHQAKAIRNFSKMRGGKGALMVKAAGNAFQSFKEEVNNQCHPARTSGLSCQNASFDPEAIMPQVITVGAVNARGVKSSYSAAGSSLLVAGLGGEYGFGTPARSPAGPGLVTTDLSGCDRGYVRHNMPSHRNDFERPGSEVALQFNAQCHYTSIMNGTSAAAPTVTGVVALMLGANPNLTWRDVRLILAKTARKIDAGFQPTILQLAGRQYTAEPGWTRNKAGLEFHNWYGYGLVDAAAAVAMAKSYTGYLTGEIADSGWRDASPSLPVPLEDPDGAESRIAFGDVRTIEAVQVRVSIDGDGILGDLGIELISPGGTRSVLMNAHNAFQLSSRVENLLLASNAFNEENAKGDWTLRVVDVNGRKTAKQALLKSWSLRVYGR